MKVLLLNQFFHPDLSATAQLATDLAEDLVRDGFQVTALAARGAYLGGKKLPARENHRGIEIVRVPCTSLGKGSIAARLADYGSFLASASAAAIMRGGHDVVVSMSTPPLVASIGAMLRTLRGTRFVYWLQDVYPELAFEFGVLGRGSPAAWMLDRISRWTLRRADAVVVLGDAMAERVRAKGVPDKNVRIVPNWADGVGVRPVPREANAFRREHGLDGKKVVLYSGNMGRGHDMATLLEAASLLKDEAGIVFVFIGEGAKRSLVEQAARELPSIRLLPYVPRERLAESLSAGDLHLISQDAATLGLMEPSKLYGILAAGRPVLYVGPAESEVARTIVREHVGAVVANGDGAGAAAAILDQLEGPGVTGTRARAAFEARYDRAVRTAQFAAVLRGLERR